MLYAGDYFFCRFHLFIPADLANLADFFSKIFLRKSALSAGNYFPADFIYFSLRSCESRRFFLLKVFCVNQCYPREIIFPADFIYLFPQISRISQIFSLKSLLRKSALSAGDYFSCRFHLFFPADLANLADFFS